MKIAVARDEAFNFTYRENIDRLREIGEVVFFSPIRDRQFPLNASEASLLYLPGGYPEFFLRPLSANTLMLTAIHDFIEGGGRCLAECGGMMYLCQHIIDEEGMAWPMAAVLPGDATMTPYYIYKNLRASYVHLYWGDKNIMDLWKDFTP